MTRKRIPAYCPLCISRCGCIATVEDGRLTRLERDPAHPTGSGLCIKGKVAAEQVESPERLLYPVKRSAPKGAADPGWKRISWDEALTMTADHLRRLADRYGAETVAFSVTTPSGTAVGDAMPWLFRLINAYGSPNTVWTTHVCNWHKDFTPLLTMGADNGMPDYEKTGCIIHWGFNASTCWLAQASATRDAMRRGARLIVVDPRRSGLANQADLWLRVRPGTDGALMLGIAGEMIANGWYDVGFLTEWSTGPMLVRDDDGRLLSGAAIGGEGSDLIVWDAGRQCPVAYRPGDGRFADEGTQPALAGRYEVPTTEGLVFCQTAFARYGAMCRDYPPERVALLTGVPAAQVRAAARMIHEHAPVSYYAWAGLGQGTNASQTSRALNLLYALTGDIDAPGGNVWFTKPTLNNVAGAELMSADRRARALGAAAYPLGPHARGWITTRELYPAITEGKPYRVRGLVAFGSNLLTTRPRPDQGEAALAQLEFYVHCDLHHNPMTRHADLVLPVASPWEREGLMGGFAVSQRADARLQLRPPLVAPRGESHSETAIVFELARRLGLGEHFFDGDPDGGLRHILAPSGVDLDQLRQRPEGVQLPLGTRYHKYRERGFNTPSQRLEIYSQQLLEIGQSPLPDYRESAAAPSARPDLHQRYPLVLTCAKWLPYCHSQYREIPGLRRQLPEPLVELHPATASARGIDENAPVRLYSPVGSMRARARFNASLDPGVLCAQYGWWSWDDGPQGDANYASLIDNTHADPLSGSLPLRASLCEVRADVEQGA